MRADLIVDAFDFDVARKPTRRAQPDIAARHMTAAGIAEAKRLAIE
jgi:hypothetical protein